MTIIITYENMIQLMTTLFLSLKVKKKITINFRNIFDTAIGLIVLERRFEAFRFEKFLGGMPPDPPRGSRLRRSQTFPVPLKVARFQFNSP